MKRETIQKAAAAPTIRKVVTDNAENSCNADLPMGAINPHMIFAVSASKWPLKFLSLLIFLTKFDAKITKLSSNKIHYIYLGDRL